MNNDCKNNSLADPTFVLLNKMNSALFWNWFKFVEKTITCFVLTVLYKNAHDKSVSNS
ncbi:hypothetical protein SAMN03003324_02556 [Pedobacter antarcticus]|uniref:Uncharacterized protein n=1 Tax=Pedobacter antarcticus TaxID=34086 RepID=A0A1I2G9R2_9SPHI|nr:hypothetical protein SAMN03003324_02556 [Pedobacter antarcticus]